MSSSRPAKRPRSSSDSKPGSSWPRPTSSANSVPLLLRKLEPEIVIAKCLEAMASERLLRSSDLIDIIIQDSFLEMHPLQNRNKTNIKDTKLFICKQIGPILHRIINEYLDSYVNVTTDTQSPTPSPLVSKRTPVQESSQVVNTVDTPLHAHPDLVERSPSGFARDVASLGLVPGDIDPISAAEHIAPTDIGNWLSRDNPFPFRKNYELIQPSPVSAKPNKTPMEDLSGLSKFQWGSGDTANSKSEAGAQEENTSIPNTSPLRTKHSTSRIPSVNGNAITDRQDTKSIISTSRVRTSRILRSCTFCGKELPSPSARREHESIHIANLCQWKQYQCKHCGYRSHRPREIWSHMKSRHDADKRRRGLSLEDLIDHGPLSEEKMAALRQQYQDDNSNSNNIINLTTASFNIPAQNNPKAPDRDRQTDRDELASNHHTMMSIDYSYTQNTPIQPHVSQQISSSMFGMGSHFDETNSLILRDNMDQSSQVDYQMHDYANFRNSIGAFSAPAILPQGSQLMGVGAHAGSSLSNIPSTLDVEEDAQGENDVEWSENLVFSHMKGG